MFNDDEINTIKKEYDFTKRLNDSYISNNSSIFTTHGLDTENSDEVNMSTSFILAPYNTDQSNQSDEENIKENPKSLSIHKREIKFSSQLREINRQYEKNHNIKIGRAHF